MGLSILNGSGDHGPKTSSILLLPVIFLLPFVALIIVPFLYSFTGPLGKVPGPLLARLTRFWELVEVRKNHFEQVNIDLHNNYGPVVRLAPGRYSLNDPSAAKAIYGHGKSFAKAPFYYTFGNPVPEESDLFNEQDPSIHAAKRRRVASLYSMTNLLSYEPFVDKVNLELCSHLRRMAKEGTAFHVPKWMQFYAFDVIGEITVGESFGFMKAGKDHNGILQGIHDGTVYGSRVGLFPELHYWIGRIANTFSLTTPFDVVIAYIRRHVKARKEGEKISDRNDFLTKLVDLGEKGKIEELDFTTTIGANIAAGSDTTGIALASTIYYLLKNPRVLTKLVKEIDEFAAEGKISNPVTFTEAQKMTYLQAVIKEVLRIHPATGQPMSRIVPAGGVEIGGQFFPEGTSVGINPWVMHYNTEVFGPDAAEFRPERWLEDKEKTSVMEQNFLAFGAGARTCLGKNISMLEMTKLIPQVYRQFKFRMVDPSKEWELDTVWFVKQHYDCFVELR